MSLDDILAPEYRDLPRGQLEQVLQETLGTDVTPEDVENFWGSLQKVGGAVSKALPGVASGALTGATTGAALGPYGALGGALIGGALGGVAQSGGSSQRPATPQAAPQTPATPAQQPQTVSPGQPAAAPVPAAAQLLQAMFQPEVLQALMAMMMGQAGRRDIPVGGKAVPVGAFTNLLGVLANQAAAEHTAAVPNGGSPGYLSDYAGQPVVDPAVDEQRAQVLYELLREADAGRRPPRAARPRRTAHRVEERLLGQRSYERRLDDEFFDMLELTELGGGHAY